MLPRLTNPLVAVALLTFGLSLAACGGGGLELGAPVPAVVAPDHEGNPVDIAAAAREGYTLVYFYPKADTPGCTDQACSLRDEYDRLAAAGVEVFGVSLDTAKDQKAFREKYQLPFTLIADQDHVVVDAFGVPRPGGFAKRQAFLFKDGELVWRDLNASTVQQASEVLAAVESAAG